RSCSHYRVMAYSHEKELFRSLEFKESRHRSVWMSIGVHFVLFSVLLLIPLIFTDAIRIKYDTVLLAPPPPPMKPILEVTHYRLPPPRPKPPEPKAEKPIVVPPPVKPDVLPKPLKPPEPPKIAEPKPSELVAPKLPKVEEPPPAPSPPKAEVRT